MKLYGRRNSTLIAVVMAIVAVVEVSGLELQSRKMWEVNHPSAFKGNNENYTICSSKTIKIFALLEKLEITYFEFRRVVRQRIRQVLDR